MHPNGIDIVWDASDDNEDVKVTVCYFAFTLKIL
jgi:hypothetical protein